MNNEDVMKIYNDKLNVFKREYKAKGYDVDSRGAKYFFDVYDQVKDLVSDGKSNDEIKEVIPGIELDLYHFAYEVGRSKFENELNSFVNSNKDEKHDNVDNFIITSAREDFIRESLSGENRTEDTSVKKM